MKNKIKKTIEDNLEYVFKNIGTVLYKNPEISEEEYKSCKLIVEFMEMEGFTVEENFCNIETAFKAVYKGKKPGEKIAFLCEYDALPNIGHGCGHNLISSMSILASLGLKSVIDEVGGEIHVFGTPAEETNGAKVKMTEMKVFEDMSIAMMTHPNNETVSSGTSLALCPIQFEFFGKTSHAAKEPEKGINSLEAVVSTYTNINSLRQYLPDDVRIHGIIDNGGTVANVIPDYASCKFYARAAKRDTVEKVIEKMKNCAKAASLSVGAKLEFNHYELSYDDMVTNNTLSQIFNSNLLEAGEPFIIPVQESSGSIDMGNVSYQVPSIHPWINIGCGDAIVHSKEFAESTQTENAKLAVMRASLAMAYTSYDVLTNSDLLKSIKEEFKNSI